MITLILPGYSPENKDWLNEASVNIKAEGETRPVYWNHWADFHKKFDAQDKSIDVLDVLLDDSAIVIAKSIGSLVAAHMILARPEKVQKLIICGLPLTDLSDEERNTIKEALAILPKSNVLCIQNENDPHGSFKEVADFIKVVNPEIKIISKESGNHEYPYYQDINDFLG